MRDNDGCAPEVVVFAVVIILLIVLSFGGYWANYEFSVKPAQNNAFVSRVSGLVADYCKYPQYSDYQGARQNLISFMDAHPDETQNLLSPQLLDKAKKVYAGDRSVCN